MGLIYKEQQDKQESSTSRFVRKAADIKTIATLVVAIGGLWTMIQAAALLPFRLEANETAIMKNTELIKMNQATIDSYIKTMISERAKDREVLIQLATELKFVHTAINKLEEKVK